MDTPTTAPSSSSSSSSSPCPHCSSTTPAPADVGQLLVVDGGEGSPTATLLRANLQALRQLQHAQDFWGAQAMRDAEARRDQARAHSVDADAAALVIAIGVLAVGYLVISESRATRDLLRKIAANVNSAAIDLSAIAG